MSNYTKKNNRYISLGDFTMWMELFCHIVMKNLLPLSLEYKFQSSPNTLRGIVVDKNQQAKTNCLNHLAHLSYFLS